MPVTLALPPHAFASAVSFVSSAPLVSSVSKVPSVQSLRYSLPSGICGDDETWYPLLLAFPQVMPSTAGLKSNRDPSNTGPEWMLSSAHRRSNANARLCFALFLTQPLTLMQTPTPTLMLTHILAHLAGARAHEAVVVVVAPGAGVDVALHPHAARRHRAVRGREGEAALAHHQHFRLTGQRDGAVSARPAPYQRTNSRCAAKPTGLRTTVTVMIVAQTLHAQMQATLLDLALPLKWD